MSSRHHGRREQVPGLGRASSGERGAGSRFIPQDKCGEPLDPVNPGRVGHGHGVAQAGKDGEDITFRGDERIPLPSLECVLGSEKRKVQVSSRTRNGARLRRPSGGYEQRGDEGESGKHRERHLYHAADAAVVDVDAHRDPCRRDGSLRSRRRWLM